MVRLLAGLAERRNDAGVEPLPDDRPERGDDRGGREERRSCVPALHEKRHGDERHEHDDRGDPREGVVVGLPEVRGGPEGEEPGSPVHRHDGHPGPQHRVLGPLTEPGTRPEVQPAGALQREERDDLESEDESEGFRRSPGEPA